MQSIFIREFFSVNFWNVLLNAGLPFLFHVHQGVRTRHTWRWVSARLSSRNCTQNSILSKDLMDFILGCIDKGWLLLLSRRPGFSRFVEASVSRSTPESLTLVSTLFESRKTLPVIFHSKLGKFEAHIIEVLFLRAQLWTVTHHLRLIKILLAHSGAFSDGTCTGGWFWIFLATFHWCQSPTFMWMSECTNTNFSALVPWVSNMYLGIADAHQRTNLDFSLLLLCASFLPPFIPCPLLPSRLKSTWLGVRDLLHILSVSRSKRLWETDLQSCCLNHSWLSNPHYAHFVSVHQRLAEQNNVQSLYSFLPKSTRENTLYYPGIEGYSKNLVPQVRHIARRDNMRLLPPVKKDKVNSCTKL